MMQRRHFTTAMAALAATPLAHAQAWPDRPIRWSAPIANRNELTTPD